MGELKITTLVLKKKDNRKKGSTQWELKHAKAFVTFGRGKAITTLSGYFVRNLY